MRTLFLFQKYHEKDPILCVSIERERDMSSLRRAKTKDERDMLTATEKDDIGNLMTLLQKGVNPNVQGEVW